MHIQSQGRYSVTGEKLWNPVSPVLLEVLQSKSVLVLVYDALMMYLFAL